MLHLALNVYTTMLTCEDFPAGDDKLAASIRRGVQIACSIPTPGFLKSQCAEGYSGGGGSKRARGTHGLCRSARGDACAAPSSAKCPNARRGI